MSFSRRITMQASIFFYAVIPYSGCRKTHVFHVLGSEVLSYLFLGVGEKPAVEISWIPYCGRPKQLVCDHLILSCLIMNLAQRLYHWNSCLSVELNSLPILPVRSEASLSTLLFGTRTRLIYTTFSNLLSSVRCLLLLLLLLQYFSYFISSSECKLSHELAVQLSALVGREFLVPLIQLPLGTTLKPQVYEIQW